MKLNTAIAAIFLITGSSTVSANKSTPYELPTPYWEPAKRAYAFQPIEVYTIDNHQGICKPNDSTSTEKRQEKAAVSAAFTYGRIPWQPASADSAYLFLSVHAAPSTHT